MNAHFHSFVHLFVNIFLPLGYSIAYTLWVYVFSKSSFNAFFLDNLVGMSIQNNMLSLRTPSKWCRLLRARCVKVRVMCVCTIAVCYPRLFVCYKTPPSTSSPSFHAPSSSISIPSISVSKLMPEAKFCQSLRRFMAADRAKKWEIRFTTDWAFEPVGVGTHPPRGRA